MKARTCPQLPLLLVDDEAEFLESARLTLAASGFNNVITCQESHNVMALLSEQRVGVALLDVMMPGVSGQELLSQISAEYPEIQVILITAVNDVDTAVASIRAGAVDYLVKPVDSARLLTTVKRAVELREIREENETLKRCLFHEGTTDLSAFSEIVTQDSVMFSIFRYIESVASTSRPVLITGETGVGKDTVANLVHTLSGRPGDMVTLNVAGIKGTAFSDSLFGHHKGADRPRAGLVEQAAGGTLFLDEIGDLSARSQLKLLRFLQDGKYYPVGSDVGKLSDARIVVATNRNVATLQCGGPFRRDLFYRLSGHHIHVPPLRDRLDDLPLLLEHFLDKAATDLGRAKPTPPRELVSLLRSYDYPGNVRELEGMVFDAVNRHTAKVLSMQVFIEKMGLENRVGTISRQDRDSASEAGYAVPSKLPTLKEAEQQLIQDALSRADGNQAIAARVLGISRQALNNRLRRNRSR